MIAKIFINSAPLLVEPSEQGGAPRLALGSQPSNDNFVGTIYFGHWFKGDDGKSAYELAVQSGYQGSEEQYGLYPIVQGDYAKVQGDYAASKAAQYLVVAVTGSAAAPVYAFTKANFDAVAMAVNNGAPVFVKISDDQRQADRLMDWSGIYPAIWNTTLSQIEIQSPNIGRAFYLDGSTPTNRGCVTCNTAIYLGINSTNRNDIGYNIVKFNPISGCYEVGLKFEYGGRNNVTEKEMRNIYEAYLGAYASVDMLSKFRYCKALYFVGFNNFCNATVCITESFRYSNMRTVVIGNLYSTIDYLMLQNTHHSGSFSTITQYVIGVLRLNAIDKEAYLDRLGYAAVALREIRLWGLKVNLSMAESAHLSHVSLMFLINNSQNSSVITVTLHPTALARLTPEDIALASSRKITLTA